MSFVYKNKKTGKVIKREKPITGKEAQDFILVSWIRNMMIKAGRVIKK